MKTNKKLLKAVMPLMLLGTPAIAVSSIRSGSRFKTKKAVVESQSVVENRVEKVDNFQNPFGVFGENTEVSKSSTTQPDNVMSFLAEEGLLIANNEEISIVSVDDSRKDFLSVGIKCVSGATYNSKSIVYVYSQTITYNSFTTIIKNSTMYNNAKTACTTVPTTAVPLSPFSKLMLTLLFMGSSIMMLKRKEEIV